MRRFLLVAALFLLILIPRDPAGAEPQELKVYCGITMVRAMTEMAATFEKQQGCKINIIPGGSGDLKMMLLNLKNGDLYLPGEDSFITDLEKNQPGLVVDKRQVGSNRASLVVKKGNPKKVAGVDDLLRSDLKVVLGHPERGSIGKMTAALLKKKGTFDQVMAQVKHLEPESKNIMNAIKFEGYDLAINWHAAATSPEHREFVDTLPIPEELNPSDKLLLAVLQTSAQPELARNFMNFAASAEGKAIFVKHGLQ